MITYNHAPFISQSIEGVLMQETSFPFELVIGEDESTDGTRKVCEDYAKKYPDIIRLHLRSRSDPEKERYAAPFMHNFLVTLAACRGKYIALCEGDDYWTDPKKLQKQVDFLEAHPEYVMCFQQARVEAEDGFSGQGILIPFKLDKDTFQTEDLCERDWFYPTASIVFRRHPVDSIPDYVTRCKSGDIALVLYLSLYGKIKYLNECSSVYRYHAGGISRYDSGFKEITDRIYLLESFDQYTKRKYTKYIRKGIVRVVEMNTDVSWLEMCKKGTISTFKKKFIAEVFDRDDKYSVRNHLIELSSFDRDLAALMARDYFRQTCWRGKVSDIRKAVSCLLSYDPGYLLQKSCIGALLSGINRSWKS